MRPIKLYWGWRGCAKGVVWVKALNSEAAGHSAGAGGRAACIGRSKEKTYYANCD